MASSNFDKLTRILATSTSRRQTIRALFASVLGGALGFGGIGAAQADGNCGGSTDDCGSDTDNFGIWNKIKDCVAGKSSCTAVEVDRSHKPPQWVLFQEKPTNYTLFAGQRRKGIECHKIWQMGAPNYWEFALNAGEKYLKHPYRIGLAINSKAARTECQLHIHVSCIQTGVQKQLEMNDKLVAQNPMDWKNPRHTLKLDYTAKGTPKMSHFRALYLKNLDQNLFRLLRDHVVGNDSEMQYQTLVVTVRPKGGFYVLNSTDYMHDKNFGGTGAGEELLDETCS